MRGRRKKLDSIVAYHLDRRGIPSGFWLEAALESIAECERGDATCPVHTGAGPVPARTVVVLLALENFVEGPIDWQTPLLDGSEPGQWFLYPPMNELSLDGANRSQLDEAAALFFPTGEEEDI